MATKLLQTEVDMKDIHETIFLKSGIPYIVDDKGMVEAEDGTKIPLHMIWVNFKVIHRGTN